MKGLIVVLFHPFFQGLQHCIPLGEAIECYQAIQLDIDDQSRGILLLRNHRPLLRFQCDSSQNDRWVFHHFCGTHL